jgi:hypothetical protein
MGFVKIVAKEKKPASTAAVLTYEPRVTHAIHAILVLGYAIG